MRKMPYALAAVSLILGVVNIAPGSAGASTSYPTFSSQASSDSIELGGYVYDSVVMLFAVSNPGTVTFKLYRNDPACVTAPVFTSPPVPLQYDGTRYPPVAFGFSGPVRPTMTGTYYFQINYSGDAAYASASECGGSSQSFTVTTPHPPSTNVALYAPATAMAGLLPAGTCTAGSGPDNAVDDAWSNIYTDKWCVRSGNPSLKITLPSTANGYHVSQIVIKHAGAGGESPTLNTRAYTLIVTQQKLVLDAASLLKVNLPITSTIATVTDNTANISSHNVDIDNVTEVTLRIDKPTQGTNPATRIYEVQVLGYPSPLPPA